MKQHLAFARPRSRPPPGGPRSLRRWGTAKQPRVPGGRHVQACRRPSCPPSMSVETMAVHAAAALAPVRMIGDQWGASTIFTILVVIVVVIG